ncbi:uncharacterized protein [Euwallacea fornicatus]|uniref:uncharacterized protein isoform X1 n=1 Tax=Euwallacea fornicatus TaxID=995702 RepID=UPI00338EEB2B
MASIITSDDETSEDYSSYCSPVSSSYDSTHATHNSEYSENSYSASPNIVKSLINRERYGRNAKGPRAKTEPIFRHMHPNCGIPLTQLLTNFDSLSHVYMGFTLCGQYLLSFTVKEQPPPPNQSLLSAIMYLASYEYILHVWKFNPCEKLQYVSHHKIFNHIQGPCHLDRIMFMQFPNDMHKVVCYGYAETNTPDLFHISILTLPSPTGCMHCFDSLPSSGESDHRGWCAKHGFIVHYMFATSQPAPIFDPKISLSFPDHLVINTGYHIHILNISTTNPPMNDWLGGSASPSAPNPVSNDMFSDVSESTSDYFGANSVVDAILEDFSEYDLDSSEGNKPFHELNISCEPLNVTAKSYHNTLVKNIFDPRIKRLQNGIRDYVFSVPHASNQKPPEKNKVVDKNVAEKAYEFTEENEKYEKISLFRKKRLADKKYEFSEDNSENIVPLHILRRERRYLYRTQSRSIRSPEFNSLFLSPRSPGWRSPMQSPSSRSGQFSPSGACHIYCTSVRNSPYHSKSPISPRDLARKVNVYSPSLDGDCSDSESRLVLKASMNFPTYCHHNDNRFNQSGLLIVDPNLETGKWFKKVVRRYSNGDFENSSLLSGQSRDDCNNPIEVPLLVQSLTDQHLDIVPECKANHETDRQIIVSQRSMDCEQFVQRRAQALCFDANLQFMHCQDYDVRILCVCPLNGEILGQVVIKIAAINPSEPHPTLQKYWSYFLFTWNISTDDFEVVDSQKVKKLFTGELPFKLSMEGCFNSLCLHDKEPLNIPKLEPPKFHCNEAWVLTYDGALESKKFIRDSKNLFEIYLYEDDSV